MAASSSHREALLSNASEVDVQPLNSFSDSAESAVRLRCRPPRPMLGVSADWKHQQQSFQFDPVLRSPFFYSLSQRRVYYSVLALTVLLWLSQTTLFHSLWTRGWPQASLLVALQLLLNLPLLLMELTRMDRCLLGRLMCTFEWWYLFCTYLLMQSMLLIRTLNQPGSSDPDILYYAVLNFIYFIAIYTISMDSLVVHSRARNKIIWLCIFITIVSIVFVLTRLDYHFEDDVKLCLVYCATAGSIESSCMLTVLAFDVKLLVNLIRRPDCLMILAPVCKLTQQDDADQQRQQMQLEHVATMSGHSGLSF